MLHGPEKNPEFLGSLDDHGTRVLLDDSGWRYRYAPTFDVATMAKATWAPPEPSSTTDSESMGRCRACRELRLQTFSPETLALNRTDEAR